MEGQLLNKFIKEVDSSEIAKITMKKLKAVDVVSYIRFASVYYEFSTTEEFITEIKKI